jgi:hypothetical protein
VGSGPTEKFYGKRRDREKFLAHQSQGEDLRDQRPPQAGGKPARSNTQSLSVSNRHLTSPVVGTKPVMLAKLEEIKLLTARSWVRVPQKSFTEKEETEKNSWLITVEIWVMLFMD